jgi:hypothetical protein
MRGTLKQRKHYAGHRLTLLSRRRAPAVCGRLAVVDNATGRPIRHATSGLPRACRVRLGQLPERWPAAPLWFSLSSFEAIDARERDSLWVAPLL